jgi:hypothetical protein
VVEWVDYVTWKWVPSGNSLEPIVPVCFKRNSVVLGL